MESLRNLFCHLNFPPKIKENLSLYLQIRRNWKKIFEKFSEQTLPLYIEKGVLYVGVSDNYLLQDLNNRYLEVLEKIKECLEEAERDKIEGLKFVFYRDIKDSSKKTFFKRAFSEKEFNFLREFCKNLPDKELSQSFQRVLGYFFQQDTLKNLKTG